MLEGLPTRLSVAQADLLLLVAWDHDSAQHVPRVCLRAPLAPVLPPTAALEAIIWLCILGCGLLGVLIRS